MLREDVKKLRPKLETVNSDEEMKQNRKKRRKIYTWLAPPKGKS